MSKLVEYIKIEEFNKLLSAEKKQEYKLAYLLAFGSGLRLSEIVGYKRKQRQRMNKETKKLEFFKDVVEIKPLDKDNIDLQAKMIRVIGGKGNKSRVVPLFPNFSEKHLKLLPLTIPRSTLQHHFSALALKTLGKHLHFHQLRHGFAVLSIKKGVKLNFIQQAMGHSRLDTTGIYLQANPEDMVADFSKSWGNG
jgi:integrase